MTIADWLIETMKKLGKAGVDSPRRDALVLLEDVLNKNRAWVLSNPDKKLDADTLKEVNSLIARRVKREPLAYIRQKAWFYGKFFVVNPDVLIPRPETESIIELLLEEVKLKKAKALDVGCGSGCIGITIKLERPEWSLDLIDIDDKALEITKVNAEKHKVDVEIRKSDLLKNIDKKYDVLAVNLPYVPEDLITSPEIEAEPKKALFSGKEGLDIYKTFWQEVTSLDKTKKPKYIICESMESQHMIVAGLARDANYTLFKTKGLIQLYANSKYNL